MDEHPEARYIVETLVKNGFIAYYAGGWVRDFLLQHPSDDIDIATSAPPETIQALFSHTVPVGIAFGILLVVIEDRAYEVATFRQDFDYRDGRRPSRIEFGLAKEDALRRDFTINGMFYDPLEGRVIDYVKGQEDLKKGVIRAIGNPHERIKEDRLRMIRAIRLAHRFGFQIEAKTAEAIHFHAHELFPAVAIERIVNELEKGRAFGKLTQMLEGLHEFRLLEAIFPALTGTSLAAIKERLKPLIRYPKEAPLIAFLLSLFPSFDLKEALDLIQRLKLTNADRAIVSFLFQAKIPRANDAEWAHFYAHPLSALSLQILAAHENNPAFLATHQKRKESLKKAIERISSHMPVVSSADLMNEGVKPGKIMGQLLHEAEEISINQRIDDKRKILELLKKSSHWPI